MSSPLGDLSSVEVRGSHDQRIGRVAGVLIDPAERRLRFFVVAPRPSSDRSYLLPTDSAARIDPERRSLHLDVDAEDLADYPEFRRSTTQDYTDDDLLAALFARPA